MRNTSVCVLLFIYNVTTVFCQLLQPNSVHKTPAAERPANDLWCYRCQTMEPGDKCDDIKPNYTMFSHKCKDDKERQCMIKRLSYTMSTENLTSTEKMWSLERNCTKHCEPGCIVIGERTKIFACTTCCDKSLCNNGTGGTMQAFHTSNLSTILPAILIQTYLFNQNGVVSIFRYIISFFIPFSIYVLTNLCLSDFNKFVDIL